MSTSVRGDFKSVKEMKKQYKVIPSQIKEYEGSGGVIVGGLQEKFGSYRLFVDEEATHTLVFGIERSGKTEMFTVPMIDVLSRAKDKTNLIIHDLRGELANKTCEMLKGQGYAVRVVDFSKSVIFIDLESGDLPVAIFMVSDPYDRKSLNAVSDFISVNGIGVRNGRKTHFILDDFSLLPPITRLSESLGLSKIYGTHFHLVIQSYNQLELLYGKESEKIISNCSNQIYILTMDVEVAKYFVRLVGSRLIEGIERPIITIDELMTLKGRESIVVCKDKKPIFNKGITAQKGGWEYLSERVT